jgi:phosphoribosylformylglycinamidine cyclo-ligase
VEAHRTGGLALDILHHSLNDVLCEGAEGLAVLFYVGCHSADPALLEPLLASVQTACRGLGLVLLEAAVAEKPELYREGEYDVCACLAGTVDAQSLVQGSEVGDGDLMIGLGSSGLHTNGYSLARRALLERGGLELGDGLAELGSTLGEALLAPHHNYAPAVLPVLRDPALGAAIHGVAHITGGGLGGNLVRVVPPGLTATVRLSSWEPPALFRLIQRAGGIPDSDAQSSGMYEAFNMGIGLVLIVDPDRAEAVSARLAGAGEQTRVIGSVHRQPGLGSRRRAASPGRVELLR